MKYFLEWLALTILGSAIGIAAGMFAFVLFKVLNSWCTMCTHSNEAEVQLGLSRLLGKSSVLLQLT